MKQYLVAMFFLCFMAVANAQTPDLKTGISFKALLVDYQTFNLTDGDITDFTAYHQGFELGFHKTLGNNLNLNIPLKVGIVQDEDDVIESHKTFIGLDAKVNYQFYKPDRKVIPYLLAGVGYSAETHEGEGNLQIPVGFGLNFKMADRAYINFQSEFRKSLSDDRDNLHHGLGFVYLFGKKDTSTIKKEMMDPLDSDGDGLVDDVDLCPQSAGPKELNGCPDADGDMVADFEDECPQQAGTKEMNGCPDTDGDGISDKDDECPNMAGTNSNNGCPDGDTDNDGVPNAIDNCPNIPGTADNRGCPGVDADGDGVPDDQDRCPNSKGTLATDGCPDSDGDGVPDFEDKCPTSSGLKVYNGCPDTDGDGLDDSRDKCPTVAGPVDSQGCPGLSAQDRQTLDLAMRAVQFDTGRSTIKSESFKILNQIAEIMKKYPNYNLTVNGHTDSSGGAGANLSLSERRAKACHDYIKTRGISAERMNYAGYGETKPIADNNTLRGKALNRRVEFQVTLR